MKALNLSSNGILRFAEVPDPKPLDDECLVKVKSAGVCSSDIYRAFENGAYRYPLIMGHEFSGEIVEAGRNVEDIRPGEKVVVYPLIPCFRCEACRDKKWIFCSNYDYYGSRRDGAFCEYIAVKAWNAMPVPKDCDLNLATLTEPLAVAIHTLKNISGDKGEKLLVLGGGFIGLSIANLAKQEGRFKEIWLFDRNVFKLELARQFGLSTYLMSGKDNAKSDFEKYFDVVIEASGAKQFFKESIIYCSNGAKLVWMGNIQGDLTLSKEEVGLILRKEVNISGIWNSDYKSDSCDWRFALDVVKSSGWIGELVTHRVPLSKGADILEDMYRVKKSGKLHNYLKVCLNIG